MKFSIQPIETDCLFPYRKSQSEFGLAHCGKIKDGGRGIPSIPVVNLEIEGLL